MNNRNKLTAAASLYALVAAGISSSAAAQDAGPPKDTSGDIVVTAQKRDQRLIDVPISITAITSDDIAKRGASTIEDLQYSVPGISITQFSPGQQRVQIRGISVYSGLPTVGVYQDEMPLNLELNQTGQDVRLLDIARVEVLRGPQGTLYGQGAVGGTIRYITNDVDLSDISAEANGEIGAVNGGGTDWKTEAVMNAPLVTDQVGLRVAGAYQHFGGWIDNPVLGDKNVNSGHSFTVRGKLGARIGENLKITLTAQHQELKIGAQNLATADEEVFDPAPTPYKSKATLLNATAVYDLGFATLLSSTGYLKRNDLNNQDLTNSIVPFLPLLGVTAPVDNIIGVVRLSNKIFTQELRLSSNGNGPFGWTVGGFYRNSRAAAVIGTIVTPDVVPSSIVLYSSAGTYPSNSRSWAVFGEGNYKITPELTGIVGLRYFSDRRVQDTTSTIFNASAVDRGKDTFHALSPRFNLSWQPNARVNLYANVAKGFRSGGFSQTSAGGGFGTVAQTYDPDQIWAYELGAKFRSEDGVASLELSGYRNEWSDVQTTTNIPGLPTTFTSNGGKIAGYGVDGTATLSPTRALTFTLTGGWNNMEYKTNSVEHSAGDRADYVPRFTGSASAEYRIVLGSMPSFVRVDYQYSERSQVYVRNFQAIPAFSDKQNILNARVGTSNDRWSASLFARNILNKNSVTYPAFAALIYPARLQPRVLGLNLGLKY